MTEFTLKVQIGVTPELAAILGAMLQGRTAAQLPSAEVPEEKPAPTRQRKPKQEPTQAAAPAAGSEQPTNDANDAAATEAPEPSAPATDAEPKQYTEEDVRAAMDKTRRRIEGEDYKNNTSSQTYQKYHKALTATFKSIAAVLGAEKPSALPAENRKIFCDSCDELYVDDMGELTTKLPF